MDDRTRIFTRADLTRLMSPAEYRDAVEFGFRAAAAGDAHSPPPLHLPARNGGGFHAKAATLRRDGRWFAAVKVNGNFPGNPARGLPTIRGVIVLSDAENGAVLAVMDSAEITLQRTAAAGALAACHGARADAASIAICGCGAQGRAQLAALARVLPLKRGRVWDVDADKAARFARDMTAETGVTLSVAASAAEAVAGAEAIVTCTTAREPYLRAADIAPGAFIAAVGADSPDKSELHPDVLARAVIVTDVTAQCLAMGDLRHAVAAGAVRPEQVHAELAEVLSGHKPGRKTPEDIVVFDSTGTAIQDVASAVWAYERAGRNTDRNQIERGK